MFASGKVYYMLPSLLNQVNSTLFVLTQTTNVHLVLTVHALILLQLCLFTETILYRVEVIWWADTMSNSILLNRQLYLPWSQR